MDYSPPGSSVHRISHARILEWIAISFSRGSSQPRDRTWVSYIGRQILYHWATREAPTQLRNSFNFPRISIPLIWSFSAISVPLMTTLPSPRVEPVAGHCRFSPTPSTLGASDSSVSRRRPPPTHTPRDSPPVVGCPEKHLSGSTLTSGPWTSRGRSCCPAILRSLGHWLLQYLWIFKKKLSKTHKIKFYHFTLDRVWIKENPPILLVGM